MGWDSAGVQDETYDEWHLCLGVSAAQRPVGTELARLYLSECTSETARLSLYELELVRIRLATLLVFKGPKSKD